ncbi:hypothetical protein ACB092_09G052500 [Castanea dentata]
MARETGNLKNKSVSYDSSDEEEDLDDFGLALEKLSLVPRKKLLVLSLGGLLCHRVLRHDKSKIPRYRDPDTSYGSFLVYKRPHCEEFMKFCFERFEVGIWSSAREWHLNNTLDCIMRGMKSKLAVAWDQDKCTDSGFKTLEKKDKPIFLKELKKLGSLGFEHSSKVLLIDDKPYKTLLNPPHTAIFLNEYNVDQVNDTALGPNGELRLYLDGLAAAENVPSHVKEHPFGQPAITPEHSDWEYYSRIIRSLKEE